MKVVFIASGNKATGISPIVKRQGESLKKEGIEVFYYEIRGKGLRGYFANITPLKSFINELQPDIIHAHYSLSGIIASFSGAKPLVVSLMGSDVKSSSFLKNMILFFSRFLWNQTIVKSEDMQQSIGLKDIHIIPNGIDLNEFIVMDKIEACKELGWDSSIKHILFAANPIRPEKNFSLTEEALKLVKAKYKLHTLSNVEPDEVVLWMNASDVIVLSSLWEGSPNVIKEAMACSRPIVATDVGDIRWLFGNQPGHFLTSFNTDEMGQKVEMALRFSKEKKITNGRERIVKLGLDAESVAKRLLSIYKKTLESYE